MEMKSFCYWLQGYFEIHGQEDGLTPEQTEMIKRHLSLVFQHEIDPSFGDAETQAALNETHAAPASTFPNNPPGVRC